MNHPISKALAVTLLLLTVYNAASHQDRVDRLAASNMASLAKAQESTQLAQRATEIAVTLDAEAEELTKANRKLAKAVKQAQARNRQLENALHLSKQRKVYSNAELESLLALSLWPRDRWSFVTRRTPCESTNQPHVTNGPYTGLMQFRVEQLGATRAELLRPIENLDYSYRWEQMVGAGAWECS